MSRSRYLSFLFLPAALCAQQVTFATYQGGSGDETAAGIVYDSSGNVYLAGATDSRNFPQASTAGGGFLTRFDAFGNRKSSALFVGNAITAIAIDSSGNVVVAGTITASGLGFVAKFTPALTLTWISTFHATPTAVAVDSTGIYAAGSAAAGFVTTTGALQAAAKGTINAVVLKLSSDGQTPLFATYLGGSGSDAASALAVDSSGNVYLTGYTTSSDFPLMNPAQKTFGGAVGTYGDAFVAKIDSKGATLLYSTYLGGTAADQGNAIAVDNGGNAYVAGATESAAWLAGPATGTFQTAYAGPTPDPTFPFNQGDAFLAKISPSGGLAWYTYLGGSGYDEATAIALDTFGDIFLAGNNGSSNFPAAGVTAHDCHIGGRPFLSKFDSTGAHLLISTGLPGIGYDQASAMSFNPLNNAVYIAGQVESDVFFATPTAAQTTFGGGDWDAFAVGLSLAAPPVFQVSCVLNAASFLAGTTAPFPTGAVAPGEIISLFGVGLGPTPYAPLQLTAAGTVSTSIGGMTVLFDGLPAPLLYAGSSQINAVVPYGINSTVTNMTVQGAGQSTLGPIPMPVQPAVPAIFMCGIVCNDASQAAAINEDQTYNSVANPVARGHIITIFVAGVGTMSNTSDGAVTPLYGPYPTASQQITVTIRGVTAQAQYIGAAPQYVNGLLQINVYVPTSIDFGNHVPVFVQVGNYSSQDNVTIAVK